MSSSAILDEGCWRVLDPPLEPADGNCRAALGIGRGSYPQHTCSDDIFHPRNAGYGFDAVDVLSNHPSVLADDPTGSGRPFIADLQKLPEG